MKYQQPSAKTSPLIQPIDGANLMFVEVAERVSRGLILILVILNLSGCGGATEKITGLFVSQAGDFIAIDKDGSMYWSAMGGTRERQIFIGIVSRVDDVSGDLSVTLPTRSQFPNTSFRLSPNYDQLMVTWGDSALAKSGHSTEFRRAPER